MLTLPGYKGRGPGYSVRSIRSSSTASHILCLSETSSSMTRPAAIAAAVRLQSARKVMFDQVKDSWLAVSSRCIA